MARSAPDADRPRRRAALARSRRRHSLRRLRHQRRRHAEPARGGAAQLPREPVRLHEHQQGLRRRPEPHRARSSWRRAGTTPIPPYADGIPETFSIDQSLHSLFGASKVAADVMVQEYGRYFGMPTCCLRGGCLTGPNHSGVELHGFLSYLVRCNLEGREYRIFGYKGKQVRDNIHSLDVARFIHAFAEAPRVGEVYNLGGGKANSCSILEAFALVEQLTGPAAAATATSTTNRIGDHICYYSDLRKMRAHYPRWDITVGLGADDRADRRGLAAASSCREDSHHRRLRLRRIHAGSPAWVERGHATRLIGLDNFMPARQRAQPRRPCARSASRVRHGDIRLASATSRRLPAVDVVDRRRRESERARRRRRPDLEPPARRAQSDRHRQRARVLPPPPGGAGHALSTSRVYSIAAARRACRSAWSDDAFEPDPARPVPAGLRPRRASPRAFSTAPPGLALRRHQAGDRAARARVRRDVRLPGLGEPLRRAGRRRPVRPRRPGHLRLLGQQLAARGRPLALHRLRRPGPSGARLPAPGGPRCR